MIYYHIETGSIYENNEWLGTGYSGAGTSFAEGRNNPTMCNVQNKGPIPAGIYAIGEPYTHPKEGPLVMNLTPYPETNTFGRSAFHIHGNNASNDASHGCIILGPAIRKQIISSGQRTIAVI